jgi:vitamin B12 transporter
MKEIQTKRTPRFRRWCRKGYAAFASLRRQVTIGVLSVSMSTILLSTTTPVQAQTVDSLTIARELEIETVEVTGVKATPTRSAMSSTSVFDRKAGASAPVQTLESVLRLSPAIDLRERSGRGTQADIMIRGGSFDQTMVMLNGINFTDARTGHQSHSLPIDIDCIAGIDLIDGVSGVGAYAGALNIRTMPLKSRYLRIEAAGGDDGYAYGNLSGAVTKGRFSLFAAGSYRRSDGYIHNTDFENYNGYLRMNYDSEKAGFFDFQAGYQNRSFGSNGFYAAYNPDQFEHTSTVLSSLRWVKSVGRFTLNSSVSYRKNFDRYDWTRGTPMNHHNTDNAGAEFWADCTWKGGVTSLGGDYTYNHIYSTNLGEPLPTPHGKYTHAKDRHVGNLWLRHVKQWERFDVSGSAGVSFTPYGTSALWSLSGGYRPVRGLRLEVGAAQSMRLPTFTDLYYTSPAQLNNLDLKPEHAITYRFAADYARSGWNASLFTYYRQGRDIIDWVWREDMGSKWHSEQTSSLDTFGIELAGGYTVSEGFLRRVTLSYGYITTDRNADVIAKSAMDFMRHKAALAVEVHFLRRMSLALTGSVYDRNGSYTHYPEPGNASLNEERDYKPYFLLDGRLQWEKGICRLYVDATNITDTRYCDIGGIRLPGFWCTGGVTLTIGK